MKKSKVLSTILKSLVCVASVATITLFFFGFVKVADSYTLTGFQAAFGSTQTAGDVEFTTFKSAWYMFAFILTALTLVFTGASFKVKGAKYASFGFSIAAFVNMLYIYLVQPITANGGFDNRTSIATARESAVSASEITREPMFLIAVIAAGVVMVLAIVSMLVSDRAEVLESNGAKITIPKRVKRFFKDYKRELKNIVWPSRTTVLKNFLVVIVMCAIVGAYVCVLDFGLLGLLRLVLGQGQ